MNDRPLSIVHIHGSDSGGGAEIAAYSLHRELLRLGHRSRMIVAKKRTEDDTVTEIPWRRGLPGLKRFTLKIERRFGFQYLYSPSFRQVHKLFPKNLDILHIHSLHGCEGYADIGVLPQFTRLWPTIMSLHDMWMLTGHCGHGTGCERWKYGCSRCTDLRLSPAISRDAARFNWIRKRFAVRRSKLHVVPCSQWLADQVRQSPIFRNKPIHVITNAIDTDIFARQNKRYARASLGLPLKEFTILLIANSLTNRWKGITDGIQAINYIETSNILVLLVGQNIRDVADRLKHPSRAIAYQSDRELLARIYCAADVLLMPSIEEAFGLVAAEAMACGTPVIAYATGGLPEVIGKDGAGLMVPTGNVADLAMALQNAIHEKQDTTKMGQVAASRARILFSLTEQTKRFVELYGKAMGVFGRPQLI